MIIIIVVNLHDFKKKLVILICTQFASIGVLLTNWIILFPSSLFVVIFFVVFFSIVTNHSSSHAFDSINDTHWEKVATLQHIHEM
jgi:uncharacterized membrane protein YhaH (DUF805 family)